MDFFADGGLQQLFSDLHDSSQVEMSYYTHTMDDYTAKYCEHNYKDDQLFTEKFVQESLDFLLSSTSSPNTMEEDDSFPSLLLLNSELSDWEDKFLDNFIEIPELVDILPDETPLCTESCINFLQESSENLRLLTSKHTIVEDCNNKDSDKYYTCSFGECRKIYAKPAHLKAHLRRHMGEKPYVCTWPQCTWKFSRSDELSRHRRSHSGIKPFRCTFCSKCFARSDHLTKHRKVHERRLLAASKAGKPLSGILPSSILTVRPGRKKKNQL